MKLNILRILYRVKHFFTDFLEKKKHSYHRHKWNKRKKNHSSTGLHYDWCSSLHVLDPAAMYHDPGWNSVVPVDYADEGDEPLTAGCPKWLEEKKESTTYDGSDGDEINQLAEAFIAHFHDKFRLEKQESYRLYEEMLARGL